MSKTNWALLVILVIQGVLIFFLDHPCSTGFYREPVEDVSSAALFPGFEKEAAASFFLEKGGNRITLERQSPLDADWVVSTPDGRYKADLFSVDTLLTSLARLKRLDVVSRNPENTAAYGLDDASAVRLKVFGSGGEELVHLLVGKNLGALRGTYVKLPGKDEVYLEMENMRRCCDKGDYWLEAWRDKTVFRCNREAVKKIIVEGPEGRIEMEYRTPGEGEDGAWWMVSPMSGKVKPWESRRLVEAISDLRAQGFARPGQELEALGLIEPEALILAELSEEDGERQLKLAFGAEEEGVRYLVINDDPSTIYKMAGYPFHVFLLKPEELLEGSTQSER